MSKVIETVDSLSIQLSDLKTEQDRLVSKLKDYERLLTENSSSFSQYADNTDGAVYQLSLDLKKILYMNPASEAIWVYTHEALNKDARKWFERIHPDDRLSTHKSYLDMIKNNKKIMLLEYRLEKPDGTISYISDRVTLIKNKDGMPYCLMGVAIDMSNFIELQQHLLIYDQILKSIKNEKSIEISIDTILKISAISFDWTVAEIWLLNSVEDTLYCFRVWHALAHELTEFKDILAKLKIKSDVGLQGQVIHSKLPTLVTDFSAHKEFHVDVAAKAQFNTALGLPIIYQGNSIGAVMYFRKKVKHLKQNEIQLMEWIADILSHTIQKNISDKNLKYTIRHDNLTGLLNRAGLEELMQYCITNSKPKILAVIFIDIDRFKTINETQGFEVGDQLLKEIAIKIREQASAGSNIIANINGDRFVISTDKIDKIEQIQPLIDRILAIFNTRFTIKDKEIFLTVSIGISIYPYDGTDTPTLLKNADIALYQAKSQGGNTIQYCTETLQKTVSNIVAIENGLRHALVENKLKLFYQPKIDLKSGNIIGVEALLRWQDTESDLRLPDSFLSIAEQTDLIVYIGEWVLLEVCYHFPLLALQIPVAINLSARQLKVQYDIVNFVTNLISKLSIPPHLLEIEVTESVLMEDVARSLDVLLAFKKMGIAIALDDFGTGYSSFEYIRRFKPDRIKIDKSFIDKIPHDTTNVAIIRAIIALSKSLDIKVIAEGVETAEQLKVLLNEGCDEIQGFYFSKPLPLYELNNLITNGAKFKFPE